MLVVLRKTRPDSRRKSVGSLGKPARLPQKCGSALGKPTKLHQKSVRISDESIGNPVSPSDYPRLELADGSQGRIVVVGLAQVQPLHAHGQETLPSPGAEAHLI